MHNFQTHRGEKWNIKYYSIISKESSKEKEFRIRTIRKRITRQ